MLNRQRLLRLLFVVTLFLSVALHMFVFASKSQPQNVTPPLSTTSSGVGEDAIDWANLSFSSLPPILESGELVSRPEWNEAAGYDLSRTWSAGQTLDQFLKLGDFQDAVNLENFTLSDIGAYNLSDSYDLDQTALSSFELLQWQSIDDLVKAVPNLGDFKVSDVLPIQNLISRAGSLNLEGITIREALLQYPEAGQLSLGEIDLDSFTLTSIPNLVLTEIINFKDWQNTLLAGVPGLNTVPLSDIAGFLFSLGIPGVVDVAYGTAETDRTNTISGSFEEGFEVPCEENCAYVELVGAPPLYDTSPIYGKQWISGKYQKVKGGSGILGELNDGLEPTGRHPFGKAFKVVVWEVTESEGSVETALFFRTCGGGLLGCSPYFIGPVPFLSFHETDFFPLIGLLNEEGGASSESSPTDTPPTSTTNTPQPEPTQPPESEGEVTGNLKYPLPNRVPVTSEYGPRNISVRGASKFHQGIDLGAPTGTSVLASDGGIVKRASVAGGCGKMIVIDHRNGLRTGYCHLSAINVKREQSVSQGQVIGKVGSTGTSGGPHLHFMVYESGTKVNPRKYINF